MKIKVTGNRGPWIDGSPRPDGWEGNVDNALGKHLVANGLVEIKKGRPKKGAEQTEDQDVEQTEDQDVEQTEDQDVEQTEDQAADQDVD